MIFREFAKYMKRAQRYQSNSMRDKELARANALAYGAILGSRSVEDIEAYCALVEWSHECALAEAEIRSDKLRAALDKANIV